MQFTIDDISIELNQEGQDVRLRMNDINVYDHYYLINEFALPNQTVDSVKNIVVDNYRVVKHHYAAKVGNSIAEGDLGMVSLQIVLKKLHMYNMWRIMYRQDRGRDLKFITDDFENQDTRWFVIQFFRAKYPDDYAAKSGLILGMSEDELRRYEKGVRDSIDQF